MDTIIYRTIPDRCYFHIRTNSTVGRGKSNLASNGVEDIDLLIVFVSILLHLEGFQSVVNTYQQD